MVIFLYGDWNKVQFQSVHTKMGGDHKTLFGLKWGGKVPHQSAYNISRQGMSDFYLNNHMLEKKAPAAGTEPVLVQYPPPPPVGFSSMYLFLLFG